MISDDIRWYQMISDDFSDASVLSSSNVSVSKMNRTNIPFVLPGTKLCRFYAAGQPCRYGSKCTHSHGPDSGYGSQGSQAAPKEWQSYLLPKDLIWSHLIFFLNQSTKKSRSGSTFMISWCQYFLTVWFQLEEMIQLEERIQICPSCFQKKWVKEAIILELTPSPPPRFFKVLTQGAKIGHHQFQRQTPDVEVEDPSPRYVHIPELMSLKTDMPNKVGQASRWWGWKWGSFPMFLKRESPKKGPPEKRAWFAYVSWHFSMF